jgi:hypothetical protein
MYVVLLKGFRFKLILFTLLPNYAGFFGLPDAKDVFALLRGHERKVKPGEEPTFTWFKSGQVSTL